MRWEMVVWAGLAVLLIAAETFVPGAFLLWLGIAAAGVFVLVSFMADLNVLTQVIAFVVFSFASIAIYRAWFRKRGRPSEQPLLNRRAEQLVGRVVVLHQGIVAGSGQVRIDDAYWQVQGPDLPAGAQVRVTAVQGAILQVDAV